MSTHGEPGPDEVVDRFRRQSEGARPRAPLYVALSRIVAADPDLAALLLHAPGPQRLPVLFLAAVHAVVLGNTSAPLAEWYPNLTDAPRSPDDTDALTAAFSAFCADHREEIVELISTRTTQTNEVGRAALLVPVFAQLEREVSVIAQVDVGTSAGLTLLWPRFAFRYRPGGDVGPASPVELECGTRGHPPVPVELPRTVLRIGLDRSPIDATDDAQARWLEACVWPDQHDRFRNLRAALDIARSEPPQVHQGDATTDTAALVERAAALGHPVVTNTWVLVYLTAEERRVYVAELDRLGADIDLTWLFIEAPAGVPELPVDAVLADPARRDHSVLTVVRWRGGRRSLEHVATCHPHGYWMHWHGAPSSARVGRPPR